MRTQHSWVHWLNNLIPYEVKICGGSNPTNIAKVDFDFQNGHINKDTLLICMWSSKNLEKQLIFSHHHLDEP